LLGAVGVKALRLGAVLTGLHAWSQVSVGTFNPGDVGVRMATFLIYGTVAIALAVLSVETSRWRRRS
jgi:hypothetical protein